MRAPGLFPIDDYEQFLGLARAALWRLPWDVREDIAQAVRMKLPGLRPETLTRPFVLQMLRHAGIDWLRKQKEIPESQLPHPPPEPPTPPHDVTAGDVPPLCVIERRLALLFDTKHSAPHELVAYGNRVLLGRDVAEVLAELEDNTVATAATEFVEAYAAESRVPTPRLMELFRPILGFKGTARFGDLWSVERQVHDWAADIRSRVMCGNPPAFSGEEFQAALREAPNRCVVWLLHDRLGWDVNEILRHAQETVGRMAEVCLEAVSLADLGGGLDCGAGAKRPLLDAANPARILDRWVEAVKRRLRSQYHQHEKRGLEEIFSTVTQPWKTIAFLETFVLRNAAREVLRGRNGATLEDLVAGLENGRYAASWKGDAPGEASVRAWFRPLRRQISQLGNKTLRTYIEEEDSPAGDEAAISAWRSEVLRSISGRFGCKHPDTLLMAWRIGLLR